MTTEKQKRALQRFVERSSGELWSILQALRHRDVGLKNTRRLLKEDPMQDGAMKALKDWAAQWPTRPLRLGKKDDRATEETDEDGES